MTALDRAIAAPDPVHDFPATSPLEGLQRRSVGFADVLAQSVAAVAPSAAATTVIALVAGVATGATVPAVIAAALVAFLIAWTVTQFSRRMVSSGALYTYAAKGLGPVAALATGAGLLIGYGFISVFALLGGAHYLTILLERLRPGIGSPLLSAGLVIGEAALLALVLVRGIRLSTRVALVVELASVAIIVALLVALLILIGPFDATALWKGAAATPSGFIAGVVLALTAFVGFESSATLGVEARSPLRTVPRALVGTVLVAGGLYVLAAYTQVAGFHRLGLSLEGSASPIDALAGGFGLDGWAELVDVGITASFLACAVASTTALSRVLFTMGRDGVVSPWLGRTHPRHGTPISAIAVSLPLIAAVPLGLVLAGVRPWAAMEAVIVVSAVGYIVAYALVCVSAPVFLHRIGELTAAVAAAAVVAALALGGGLVLYLFVEGSHGNPGVWIALGLCLAVAVAIGVRALRHPSSLHRIGSYDQPTAAQVLGGVPRSSAADDE